MSAIVCASPCYDNRFEKASRTINRFYLALPSNSSMDYYPENTIAQHTTKLNSVSSWMVNGKSV